MYVVIVDIHIQSQHREAFLAAMLENARLSVQDEPPRSWKGVPVPQAPSSAPSDQRT
jgi:hypothetical protein